MREPRHKLMITCQIVHALDESCESCCSSCHEDAELDYYGGWMCQPEPPDTPRHRRSGRIYADVCCTVAKTVGAWTRGDWARAVRLQRKMLRIEQMEE